ncbi:hypothetical protein [Luteipulveratus mongoliensis]|uniref:hypothetical protein n=1 Tax=Luteipulveratus mongoliensis TaxID=571913 RepID=UPI0012EE544A|nr:hypothetical protein [Luteipulveratus mongoliensis]
MPRSDAPANAERRRRAASIIAEYEPWAHEYDEPPMLRLLIKHRGDMLAAADDPALVEHLRAHLRLDGFLVQAWQDLERNSPHPRGLQIGPYAVLGARLTEAVNEVRVRAGLGRLSCEQVAIRWLRDTIREATEARHCPRGRHLADEDDEPPTAARQLSVSRV